MASLNERLSAAWRAFQTPKLPTPFGGEIALADPRRMFPGGISHPYNPSVLVTRKGIKVFDSMRLDDQIKAALTFKKHAVLSTGWEVASPEGQAEDWEVTEFVRHALENLDHNEPEGTLEDDLLEILSALDYGFSVTEKVVEEIPSGPFAGRVGLRALKTRKPHDFDFATDVYGNLLPEGIIQRGNRQGEKMPREKFVLFAYDMEFSNWYGRSDLEAAYRAWWTKDNAAKWFAMYLERYAIPWFFFFYDPARYSEQQIEDLKDVAKNLQAATQGVIPRPTTESLEAWLQQNQGRTQSEFGPALNLLDQQIARAILMPGLLGLTADQQQGSFARAQVHFDVFMMVVEYLRQAVRNRVVMNQIVKPLVDLNYTVDVYPDWRWKPLTEEIRLDLLDRWLTAVGQRVVTSTPDDESYIRDQLKFPKREVAEPAPGSTIPGTIPLLSQYAMRQPNRFEKQVNFAQIERSLDDLEGQTLERLQAAIERRRDNLIRFVEARVESDTLTPTLAGQLELRGMSEVEDLLKEFVREAYGIGEQTVRRELPNLFQERGPTFVPIEALRWLANSALRISQGLRGRLEEQIRLVLLNALKFGEVQRETIAKLRKVFEPYLGDPTLFTDGEEASPHRLETILRTNATEAFNRGRLVSVRDPDVSRFIRGMEYSAVIDSRTTPVCRYLDGLVFPMGEAELDKLTPPNHWSCRSLLVPVTLDTEIDEGRLITPAQIGKAEELTGEGFK